MTGNSARMLFYERFASRFDQEMNRHEMEKRIKLVFERLLGDSLVGKRVLDAGCGTGWFSQRAMAAGADVVSVDVGPNLLAEVRRKCPSRCVQGSVMTLGLAANTFDVVLCSEVIEHTPHPRQAVSELARVLRPGGALILTVPNHAWHFAVTLANLFRLRPYQGLENWVGCFELRRWLKESRLKIERQFGFNILPLKFPWTYSFIDYFDRFGRALGPMMVNIAVKAVKSP